MPIITRISEQKRRANRRNVFLDGQFAFGCNLNVIARFRLREGQSLDAGQLEQIQLGAVKQEALDDAIRMLESRLQSIAEVRRKLARREYGAAIIEAVIADLSRMEYLDDERFARTRAQSAIEHKRHGKRRAKIELLKAGVASDIADRALKQVYDAADPLAAARELAEKKAPALRKLDPQVARRRLMGMLQRRGFEYDEIKPLLDEVLGNRDPGD